VTRPRVLVVADYYLPGFRAGGPVRAISNTIERLAADVDFLVVTRDHDADGSKYADVERGRWTGCSSARVLYARHLTPWLLRRCIADSGCDVIWLNSFFSRASIAVLALCRAGHVRVPVLLAPRGEFAPDALARKPRRKAAAMRLLRDAGCLRSIHWLASSDGERRDISRMVASPAITCVPESVTAVPADSGHWPGKLPRRLRVVFAARIAPTKNLLFLLQVLAACDGDIRLDIVGPLEDRDYWAKCCAQIAELPPGVKVAYLGEMPHGDLQRRLGTYDLLVLPTLGENFGHVVVESWAAGCPVLVSDRTPWRHLAERGIGWDVALDPDAWAAALRRALDLSPETHAAMRRRATEHARQVWQQGVAGDGSLLRLIDAVRRPMTGGLCA
jgi:glycosyltransferase involved in cell wall biosynthesis